MRSTRVQDSTRDSRLGPLVGGLLVTVIAMLFLGYNLQSWPGTWYDEGVTLQVARNIVELHKYGILSSEGFRAFSPIVSTGPTVSGAIALVFALAGIGLLQARIVMVAFALFAMICVYLLALRLFDLQTAVVASLLFVSVGATSGDISASFLGLGRMVMGEVPALALLLVASLLWYKALESDSIVFTIGAGFCWGLSFVTKPQSIFAVVGLLFTWVVFVLLRREVRMRHFIIPLIVSLACVGIWSIWQHFGSLNAESSEATGRIGTQIVVLSPHLIIKSIRVLLSQREIIWGLPGLFYGLYLAIVSRRSAQALTTLFLVMTCLLWLAWFVLGSIGWGRYAFPPLAIMMLFAGKLLSDLLGQIKWSMLVSHSGIASEHHQGMVRNIAVLLALSLMIGNSLQSIGREIVMTQDDTSSAFAQYLDRSLPSGAIVECFEPEIVFFSKGDLRFHQPTLDVLNLAIQHVQLELSYPDASYNYREQPVEYLVDGPFSKTTEFYNRDLQTDSFSLVQSVGNYDLYQIHLANEQ